MKSCVMVTMCWGKKALGRSGSQGWFHHESLTQKERAEKGTEAMPPLPSSSLYLSSSCLSHQALSWHKSCASPLESVCLLKACKHGETSPPRCICLMAPCRRIILTHLLSAQPISMELVLVLELPCILFLKLNFICVLTEEEMLS